MTPLQRLYYAIGELAYAIARADGYIQKEERLSFTSIVSEAMRNKKHEISISDIIFKILEKDKFIDTKTSYNLAINEIRLNSQYLSPELKQMFFNVVDKMSKAYPPVTKEEAMLRDKFRIDVGSINGDPIYYENTVK